MQKGLIKLMLIGCVGIISFAGYENEARPTAYNVEIVKLSQIDKVQENSNKFSDKDIALFLGWIFPL